MQTNEEIMKIAASWQQPIGLVNSEPNGKAIADGINKYFGGVWSHENLNAVVGKVSLNYRRGYSPNEIAAVNAEWWEKHAPKNLLPTNENAALIYGYIHRFSAGLYTLANMSAAVVGLGDQLGYKQEPTAEEIAKARELKEMERMKRDRQQNRKENNDGIGVKPKEQVLADNVAKEEMEAKAEVDALIAGFVPTGSRGVLYSKQNEWQKATRVKADGWYNRGRSWKPVVALVRADRAAAYQALEASTVKM